MTRKESVTMYFEPDAKAAIESEATEADMSVSKYCKQLVQEQRRARASDQLNVEQRIKQAIAEGLSEREDTLADLNERTALILHILRELEDVDESETETDGGEATSISERAEQRANRRKRPNGGDR